jgi:hypothetical protein
MKYFFNLLPLILPSAAAYLKSRDSNNTGADDAVGNILIAVGPAIEAMTTGDDSKVRKALVAIRTIIDGYLAQTAST